MDSIAQVKKKNPNLGITNSKMSNMRILEDGINGF